MNGYFHKETAKPCSERVVVALSGPNAVEYPMTGAIFKECGCCHTAWTDRSSFLADPEIVMVGYQVDFRDLTMGLFLFNHRPCKSTLALRAGDFRDLYNGPVFVERKTGSESCPGHCLHHDNLKPCPAACECAFVREIIQIVKTWEKQAAART
ncbi:MAG: hypothetical protein OHK006_12580 [Thermodesulfovibrionales bacterium]